MKVAFPRTLFLLTCLVCAGLGACHGTPDDEDAGSVDHGIVDSRDLKLRGEGSTDKTIQPDSLWSDVSVPDSATPDAADLGPDVCLPCGKHSDCGDGNPCSINFCAPDSCCRTAPASTGTKCDDKKVCTKQDMCDGKGACAGTSYTCTLGTCEVSSVCDGNGGCTVTHEPLGARCSDGDPYTKMDRCVAKNTCKALAWSPSKTCPGMLTSTDWCWYTPLPQGNTLRGVWAASKGNVRAVGTDGTILHYDGSLWRSQSSGVSAHLNAVWGTASDYAFAVGEGGVVLRRSAKIWVAQKSGTPSTLHGVWGSSVTNVVAVGAGGTIIRVSGSGWKAESSGTTSTLNAIWGAGASSVWAVGDNGTIVHFDGKGWSKASSTSTKRLRGVWGSSSSDVYAVGDAGTVLRFDGAAWKNMGPPTTATLHGIFASGPKDLHVVGRVGSYDSFYARYDGASWKTSSLARDNPLTAIGGVSASDIYAVGSNGNMQMFDGVSWSAHWRGGGQWWLRDIWGRSRTDFYVSGYVGPSPYSGIVLHYDGKRFKDMTPPGSGQLEGLWGSGGSNLYTIDRQGTAYHHDGKAWKAHKNLANETKAIWGLGPTAIYAVGYDAVLQYNGAKWKVHTSFSGSGYSLQDIWGASSTDLFTIAGYPKGFLLHYDGTGWKQQTTASTYLYSVWGTGSTNVFAVGSSTGIILRYDGVVWSTVKSGLVFQTTVWGTSSQNVYSVGGNYDKYWHNNGTSWKQKSTGSTIRTAGVKSNISGIWGTGPTDVFLSGMNRVLHYKDP